MQAEKLDALLYRLTGAKLVMISNPLTYRPKGRSTIDRWDPRLRVVATVFVAMATLALQHLLPLATALIAAVILAVVAGIVSKNLMLRLLPLELFLLILLLTLPFTLHVGEVWFQLGPLTAHWSGLERALIVALKANVVVVVVFSLIGTMSTTVLGEALLLLHLPVKLVQLFQLTLRYLEVLHREYQRLRNAMKARAFAPASNWHSLRSFGWLIGMLLVRSLDRSERVLSAMKCRGFDGCFHSRGQEREWKSTDTGRFIFFVLVAGMLLVADNMI